MLFDVDSAGRGYSCFSEATNFTRSLVDDQVRLEDDSRLEDGFVRRIAYESLQITALIPI